MKLALKSAKKRHGTLSESLRIHNHKYHVLDNPEISDEAYDSLMRELLDLEEIFPVLKSKVSPSQRVGGDPRSSFKKVTHAHKQYSFDNSFDFEGLRKWEERLMRILQKSGIDESPEYVCELKIDGLKTVLTYEGGVLTQAATRGNGSVGEDITHNVRTVRSVPLKLSKPIHLVCVGELWLSESELKRINKGRKKSGEELFVNPRNAAAGTVRQLDPKIASSRKLESFVYDIESGIEVDSQEGELEELKLLGFKVNTKYAVCKNLKEVEKYYKSSEKLRAKSQYDFDGVVVKVNSRPLQELLGHTAKAPRFGVAYKFPAEQVTTKVEDIVLQVGRTGVLTPVAHMAPVFVGGAMVSRATLHNEDFIKELDVRIGDTVVLQRAGDVIPEVVKVLRELRGGSTKRWEFPREVSLCGGNGSIERIPGQAAYRCVHKGGVTQVRRKLEHFVGKHALDIEGLGKEQVAVFLEEGLINDFADIFTLKEGDLLPLERFAQKSVENLIASIDSSRSVSLERLLIGLSIDAVGEETAIDLSNHFGSLAKIGSASESVLQEIEGVGDIVAKSVADWFSNQENKKLLKKLLKEVKVVNPKTKKSVKKLSGQSFVLTGTLKSMTRDLHALSTPPAFILS